MWKRLRRRSFAPSRPAVFPDQVGLVLITLFVIGMGVFLILKAF